MYFDSIESCQSSIDVFGSGDALPMIVRSHFQSEHNEYSAKQEEYLMTVMTDALIEIAIMVKQKLEADELVAGEASEKYGHKIMQQKWQQILKIEKNKTAV